MKKSTLSTLMGALLLVACTEKPEQELAFRQVNTGHLATDEERTSGLSLADLDGDGQPELLVTNGYHYENGKPVLEADRLYTLEGDSLVLKSDFSLDSLEHVFSGVNFGDLDNDGDLDAILPDQARSSLLAINNGSGAFTASPLPAQGEGGLHAYDCSLVDIDNDGLLDAAIYGGGLSRQGRVVLYRNLGQGQLEHIENELTADSLMATGGVWADYDLDGDQDLLLPDGNQHTRPRLYRNEGNWSFSRQDSAAGLDFGIIGIANSCAAHWWDFDNDGDADLTVGSMYGMPLHMYVNQGNGTFLRVEDCPLNSRSNYTTAINSGDIDNDGDLDLMLSTWGGASLVYLNDGAGNLHEATPAAIGKDISSASAGLLVDLDGDGDLDVLVGNWPNVAGEIERNQLYINELEGRNWVVITLRGTRSNRNAIGARVVVTATIGGREVQQTRHVTSKTTWRSQAGYDLHFGLGGAGSISKVEVFWPSGAKTSLEDLAMNQRHEIVEDQVE